MPDSLGWRANWGVVVPSTNTSVQPEFDEMRPRGVTNHIVRIWIPNNPVGSNDDFNRLMENIRLEWDNALLRVMTCDPDYLVMGMSSETFWGGLQRSLELKKHMMELTGVSVAMGSDACQAALRCYGDIKRIGVLTPYWPVADENVTRFLEDCGFEVVVIKGLCCGSPTAMSQVSEKELRDALLELNEHDVEALVQCGTNLAMARLAGEAEKWLKKPVIAINTATYWYAMRANGMDDVIEGFGSLMTDFKELPASYLRVAAEQAAAAGT
jgi:maleate isomerase